MSSLLEKQKRKGGVIDVEQERKNVFIDITSVCIYKMYTELMCFVELRPHLYGLGYPRQPSPRVTLDEATFSLFLCKINQLFTLGLQTRLGGRDNSGGRVVSPRRVG